MRIYPSLMHRVLSKILSAAVSKTRKLAPCRKRHCPAGFPYLSDPKAQTAPFGCIFCQTPIMKHHQKRVSHLVFYRSYRNLVIPNHNNFRASFFISPDTDIPGSLHEDESRSSLPGSSEPEWLVQRPTGFWYQSYSRSRQHRPSQIHRKEKV